jgi:hypothetical protein
MTDTPAEVALNFEIVDRGGIRILDWTKHGGISCRPAWDTETRMWDRIQELERQLAEARAMSEKRRKAACQHLEERNAERRRADDLQSQLAAQRERDGRDAVRRLVGLWRAVDEGDAFDGPDYERGRIETLLNCADELDAALGGRP